MFRKKYRQWLSKLPVQGRWVVFAPLRSCGDFPRTAAWIPPAPLFDSYVLHLSTLIVFLFVYFCPFWLSWPDNNGLGFHLATSAFFRPSPWLWSGKEDAQWLPLLDSLVCSLWFLIKCWNLLWWSRIESCLSSFPERKIWAKADVQRSLLRGPIVFRSTWLVNILYRSVLTYIRKLCSWKN